jgi:hypothetical protein
MKTNYAATLKGTAFFAWDHYQYWKAYKPQVEEDVILRAGNMQAYCAILRQITGRDPKDPICKEIIDTI